LLWPSLWQAALPRETQADPESRPTPVRQPPYPLGVAYFAALLALGLALVAGFVLLMSTAVEKNLPRSVVVASAAGVAGSDGVLCLYAGAGLYYQARPVRLSGARQSLVWRPPLAFRIALVIVVVSFITSALALATTPHMKLAPLPLLISGGVGILITCLFSLRLLVARLEANDWGIRCSNTLTTVRFRGARSDR
jgi:hypothetical protein